MPNNTFPPVSVTVNELDDKGRFTIVKTDQGDFSIWEDKYQFLPQLQAGMSVTVFVKETHKDGKTYRNIMGAGAMPQQTSNPQPSHTSPPHSAHISEATITRLDGVDIRTSSLGMAVRLYAAGKITDKQVDKTADEFVAYIKGEDKSMNTNVVQDDLDGFTL